MTPRRTRRVLHCADVLHRVRHDHISLVPRTVPTASAARGARSATAASLKPEPFAAACARTARRRSAPDSAGRSRWTASRRGARRAARSAAAYGSSAPGGHLGGERRQRRTVAQRADPGAQRAQRDRLDLGGGPRAPGGGCSSPCSTSQARCLSIAATMSSMPSARAATARTTCGRHSPGPALAERDHALDVAVGGVGAVPVGLVDHEDVGDLQDAGLDRLDRVAHARARAAPAWCRPARRPPPRPARRRRSRPAPRRSRRPRAPAPPAGWPRPARRGGRGWTSTGCRRRGRWRGPASGPGRRGSRRR